MKKKKKKNNRLHVPILPMSLQFGYKKNRFCGVYESEYLIREILVPKETLYN